MDAHAKVMRELVYSDQIFVFVDVVVGQVELSSSSRNELLDVTPTSYCLIHVVEGEGQSEDKTTRSQDDRERADRA